MCTLWFLEWICCADLSLKRTKYTSIAKLAACCRKWRYGCGMMWQGLSGWVGWLKQAEALWRSCNPRDLKLPRLVSKHFRRTAVTFPSRCHLVTRSCYDRLVVAFFFLQRCHVAATLLIMLPHYSHVAVTFLSRCHGARNSLKLRRTNHFCRLCFYIFWCYCQHQFPNVDCTAEI